MRLMPVFMFIICAMGCSGSTNTPRPNSTPVPANAVRSAPLPVNGYEVVKSYPHDGKAFTQGLFFHDGFLYEGTGEQGKSTLRKVELETGKVLKKFDFPEEDFGEGITLMGDKIYHVTWQQGLGRVFDLNDLKLLREFQFLGEGWGLANDGTNLYLSQGTHVIKVIEPEKFATVRTFPVMREDGKPLMQINELEMIKGELWANVWHSEEAHILGKPNYIARIDPQSGKLTGWINLQGISPEDQRGGDKKENTLNGIAYDAAGDRIFVTGKNWKKLYEIKVTPPQGQ